MARLLEYRANLEAVVIAHGTLRPLKSPNSGKS